MCSFLLARRTGIAARGAAPDLRRFFRDRHGRHAWVAAVGLPCVPARHHPQPTAGRQDACTTEKQTCRSPLSRGSRAVRNEVIGLVVILNPRRIFQLHLHDSIEDSQAAGGKTTLSNTYNVLF
jgi:hypothetical protein